MPARNCPLIQNGVVVNIILADPDTDPMPDGYTVGPEGGSIGWLWDGSSYTDPTPAPELPPVPPPPVATVAQLVTYANNKRDAVSDRGITVNVGTAEAPQNFSVDTSTAGRTDVLGLMQIAALGLPVTWYQASGSTTISAQQLTTIALAIAAHRAAAVATHTEVWAAINAAPPTITTVSQIESANWPA